MAADNTRNTVVFNPCRMQQSRGAPYLAVVGEMWVAQGTYPEAFAVAPYLANYSEIWCTQASWARRLHSMDTQVQPSGSNRYSFS